MPTGRKAIGHVTLSAFAPINYRIGFSPGNTAGQTPPVSDGLSFQYYVDMRILRLTAASIPTAPIFALPMRSVHFLTSDTDLSVLRAPEHASRATIAGKQPRNRPWTRSGSLTRDWPRAARLRRWHVRQLPACAAWDLAILLALGILAAFAPTIPTGFIRMPGHAILRGTLPMVLGISLVPRRSSGTG